MIMVILYCTNVSLGEDTCVRIMISVKRNQKSKSGWSNKHLAGVSLFEGDLVLNYLQVNSVYLPQLFSHH